MKHRFLSLFVMLALACLVGAPAFAQGTASISGVVVDTGGGAMPGVTIVVTNAAGEKFETVTNTEGVFSVPALGAGTYTITASLTGFKSAKVPEVRIQPGASASVKVVMEVGQLEETITVSSSAELINTQTPTVSSTLNADQLNRMPTPTRNAINAVTFLPGINTATTNRESRINGLPESFVSITMDGVSNNDNFLRSSDSFFASVYPRQDAIEAVTVTTAAAAANVGGSGAVTINFATRSGTNRFNGSAYEYYRHESLNSNYFFNELRGLEKNEVRLNQYGARFGGPIVLPGFDGRDKAFFFVHYEETRFPNEFTRTRVTLHPRAAEGWFRYTVAGQVREVNVMDLARTRGQIATFDPTIQQILSNINSAGQTTGRIVPLTDPLLNNYVWQSPGYLLEQHPTFRIDYNLTDKHRLSGTSSILWAERDPDYLNAVDVRFPGAPNYRYFHSRRPLHSITLRSSLTSNVVNELRGGITALGGASYFGDNSSNGPQTFEDTQGFALDFPNFSDPALTNWFATNSPSWRSAPTLSIDNTLNWQKGKHSFMFGGGVLWARAWENAQMIVPELDLGLSNTNDPAAGLFTSASGNFPGASSGQLTDARDLYALLTGRVIQVNGQAALDPDTNKYVAHAPRRREGKINMYSLFMQDSWRMTPALTLNYGLRWDLQLPFTPVNDIMSSVTMADICGISGLGDGGTYSKCRFVTPGASGGKIPEYRQLTRGTQGYDTDWNNFAPNVGIAWRPNVETGFLRRILGDPEQATIRAGYSVAYERQGMGVFTGIFGANPGSTIALTRSATTGLVLPGETWPVLLSQPSRLFNPSFNENPVFPIPIRSDRQDDINGFAPDIKIGSAGTWTIGVQRALGRDMAVDVRYVGTRGWNQWSELDYNAIRGENLINNGFLNEFRLAMDNLTANNIAGGSRAGSFAYFGPGTGTSPLPIYLGYLNGSRDFGNPAAYTGGTNTWRNTDFTEDLVRTNPTATGAAGTLEDPDEDWHANAVRAGLAENFFLLNPHAENVNVTDSGAFSDYHALQIELRRRLSKGLSANVNYQYAIEGGSAFDGFSFGRVMIPTANVRHAIKTQWDWQIPVGRGQRFGSNMNRVLDGILGNWAFNGVGRIQARVVDFGNVRLVGMTVDELTDMYKFEIRRNAAGVEQVYMLPDDVILNTRRAFSTSTTSVTGYSSLGVPEGRYIAPDDSYDCLEIHNGDCAPRTLLVRAPFFTRFDIGITKRFPIKGSVNFEVKFDVLNVFDNINFNPVTNSGDDDDILQTNSAYTDSSNTYDPGGRLGQIMFRINW
jgi:hypothetical protein